MPTELDRPGVLILPPLLVAIGLALMFALQWLWPLPIGDSAIVFWIGIALLILGVGLALWGRNAMREAGTNINPMKPSTAVVISGPFRFTRNPLYIALILLFLGIALVVGTWWGLLVLVPLTLILHYGVIVREECYLEQKFGGPYLEYKAKVRRYL